MSADDSRIIAMEKLSSADAGWTGAEIVAATGGHWLEGRAPSAQWRMAGLCTFAGEMQPGDMVVMRGEGESGLTPVGLRKLPFAPQALMIDANGISVVPELPAGTPVLQVENIRKGVQDLGRFARVYRPGKVIGVTGSAGKTTMVAMLAHVLRLWGETGASRGSANMDIGISWNLASMRRDAMFRVVEMAIGRMRTNTGIARPDIAVITNIAPAHLDYHDSVEEIARRKARIFEGMTPGAVAALCRDTPQYSILESAAQKAQLRIISYGEHAEADIRLGNYAPGTQGVEIFVRGRRLAFRNGAPGLHMAINAAGCIGVLEALGLRAEDAAPFFDRFAPVKGRGAVKDFTLDGRAIRVLDEAYNANPTSMRAAIALAAELEPPVAEGRLVLALGDMLELGPESGQWHAGLADAIAAVAPDLVLLCGEQMRHLLDALAGRFDIHWAPDVEALLPLTQRLLRDGDLVLVKSSAGVRLSALVEKLAEPEAP